jgi:3-hydroxyisobutyrate dehydrogenase
MAAPAKTVGFIGLGTMGGPLARNVLAAGFKLIVHDVRRAAADPLIEGGAVWAESPRRVGEQSDVALTSLPMPADVEAVCTGPDGVFSGLSRGKVCFDLSTNSAAVLQRLHEQAARLGVEFLDAPVSGGAAGAAARRLVIWVGGSRAAYEAHLDVLQSMGDRTAHMGELGAATAAKLVINMTGAGISCLLAETFTLGVKAGVDPLQLWQAMRASALGRRNTFDALGDRFLTGQYDPPAFAMKLAHKDVTLASDMARHLKVPVRMCDLALAEMTEAMARGWGERDIYSMMTLQQERAQVDVTIAPEKVKAELGG